MRRSFAQVDVFATSPFLGNPVAVVLDGTGLATEDMQRFAHWTNLSETTFVLPPTTSEADYRVRIFTPTSELPFAGHPTLGTCHAWLTSRQVDLDRDAVVQECGAGLVTVRRTAEGWAFAAPPLVRSGPVDEALVRRIAEVLRVERSEILDTQWVDNGPGWVAALFGSAEAVLALRPGDVGFDLGVVGPYADGSPEAFEVRACGPAARRLPTPPARAQPSDVPGGCTSPVTTTAPSGRAGARSPVSLGTSTSRRVTFGLDASSSCGQPYGY